MGGWLPWWRVGYNCGFFEGEGVCYGDFYLCGQFQCVD